jgi:hypothetical protein
VVGPWLGLALAVGAWLGLTLAVGLALAVGPSLGLALAVGIALAVGRSLTVGPSVGTVEGESDCPTVGPVVGARVSPSAVGPVVGPIVGARSPSLARHEVSDANCSQSKSHVLLPGSKHMPPGLSTIALKKGSMHTAVAAKSSSMKVNTVVKLERSSVNTTPPAVPLIHDWDTSRLLRKDAKRIVYKVEAQCESTEGKKQIETTGSEDLRGNR